MSKILSCPLVQTRFCSAGLGPPSAAWALSVPRLRHSRGQSHPRGGCSGTVGALPATSSFHTEAHTWNVRIVGKCWSPWKPDFHSAGLLSHDFLFLKKEVYRLQFSFVVRREPEVSVYCPGCSHDTVSSLPFGGYSVVSISVSRVHAYRVALRCVCRNGYFGAFVFLGEVRKTWGGHERLNSCETAPKLHLENSSFTLPSSH